MPSELANKYFRTEHMPTMWCPGCGNGVLTSDIVRAIDNLGIDQDKVCIVSGIGCSSRAVGYLDFNTVHTTHGRALAVATGIKLAKPELTVIVLMGDGDALAIGGNHLIHSCRRNIDLTAIIFNNEIYGMTGGQVSPETPVSEYGTTAPYGNIDGNFNIPRLAQAAGATFTARGSVYHAIQTISIIEKGISNHGFSVIECVSTCPTYYGRKNKKGTAIDMINWQKENLFACTDANEDVRIGVLSASTREEYTDQYAEIIKKAEINCEK